VGASEVLRLIGDSKNSKLLVILNDNYADGRDVSWIWDANFELLKDYKQSIIISGDRAYDMAVRLKYAGVDESQFIIEKEIKKALQEAETPQSALI
jgi:UDP-N-acetylmuramyl tripeptide synthase